METARPQAILSLHFECANDGDLARCHSLCDFETVTYGSPSHTLLTGFETQTLAALHLCCTCLHMILRAYEEQKAQAILTDVFRSCPTKEISWYIFAVAMMGKIHDKGSSGTRISRHQHLMTFTPLHAFNVAQVFRSRQRHMT